MFCSYCGKELNKSVNFCPYCGKKINLRVKEARNNAMPESVKMQAAVKKKTAAPADLKKRGKLTGNTMFVSSTFQDMHQERDILQEEVLPKIRDFAKQYGRDINLCDLRWGVNSLGMDEEESAIKVLQVCFDEIDQARPFFIAILGDRYGWIPDARIAEASIAGRRKCTEQFSDKSVTEMEIVYGAMADDIKSQARFYFREIKNKNHFTLGHTGMPEQYFNKTADEERRMNLLKDKIRSKFPDQLRTYSVTWNTETAAFDGMNLFAEMLYQDLKEMILQRWGEVPHLSEYDSQLHQYQYTLECDDYFSDFQKEFLSSRMPLESRKIDEPVMKRQNYVLFSADEYNLDRLFASLCGRYAANGAEVLPYICNQSVMSSSTDNMVKYFTYFLTKKFGINESASSAETESDSESAIRQFHQALKAADVKTESPIILAIRGVQNLDEEDIFRWLPSNAYKNIHFLLSGSRNFVGTAAYKEKTESFYFQDRVIFERSVFIDAYMAYYHKELDEKVQYAILQKSEGREDQYAEFLMQRILVLSQKDFTVIRNSGDGMQKISDYLLSLIWNSPDDVEGIVKEQMTQLSGEVGADFMRAVLSVLAELPYGISLKNLWKILKEGQIPYQMLNLTLLCRMLPSVVNVTLDGFYRMKKTPASKIICSYLTEDREKWARFLERYMSEMSFVKSNSNPAGETTEKENIRTIGDWEFYRSQYLNVAMKIGKKDALKDFLKNTWRDASYTTLILHKIATDEEAVSWLRENVRNLPSDDLRWMVADFYRYLSDCGWTKHRDFAAVLVILWEEISLVFEAIAIRTESESDNYAYFRALFETGELAYLLGSDRAETYLVKAKAVSKKNFSQYPNRIWKMMHGIELTEEEMHQGYDAMEQKSGIHADDGVMFGFDGEIEDADMEQSWSDEVRVIDNRLAEIYRRNGETEKSDYLEKKSKEVTHMFDPDPHHKGESRINAYTTVIWPNAQKNAEKKRRYKPDYRRNSALQISKEANRLMMNGQRKEALVKYREANTILLEIYEDGETGQYYDLDDVIGDADELRIAIRHECARDLGINCKEILFCLEIPRKDPEEEGQIRKLIDKMISWAKIYDDYRNNMQSKADLESDYLLSAQIYEAFERPDAHANRIMNDIDQYLTYRLEAHQKGEKTDRNIMKVRKTADCVLYNLVTGDPDLGSQATDLLLRQSNETVKTNDFNGFVDLTNLMENLLRWMWEHEYFWEGTQCALEDIYFANMNNQCMLWEQRGMSDRLENDALRIAEMLPEIKKAQNIQMALQCMLRYMLLLFRTGKYAEAAAMADRMIQALQKVEREFSLYDKEVLFSKFVAVYSEAGQLKKAYEMSIRSDQILEKMECEGCTASDRARGILPEQYRSFVVKSRVMNYLNTAIICSRLGKIDEGQWYLDKADDLANCNPRDIATEHGLRERIDMYQKYGLPKNN